MARDCAYRQTFLFVSVSEMQERKILVHIFSDLPPGSRENSGLGQEISGRLHIAKGLLTDPQRDSALTHPGRDSDSYPPRPCLSLIPS